MADKDYYNILGVSQGATKDEIKKAYRKLAKKYHPDANQENPESEDRFKELVEAYEVLSNEEKRRQYDQMREWAACGFPGGGGPWRGVPGGQGGFASTGTGGPDFDFQGSGFDYRFGKGFSPGQESSGSGIFDDLFSMFFDRDSRLGRSGRYHADRRSLHTDLTIPFDVAAAGGSVTVKVRGDEQCAACGGTGAAGGKYVTCEQCGGAGMVSYAQGAFSVSRPCPQCLGRGIVFSNPCPQCQGQGQAPRMRTIKVTIPSGTDDGHVLRLKNQGAHSVRGGLAGDLLIRIHVRSHPFFHRRGLDLYCEVPVHADRAERGARIKVRTLGKRKVLLTVPPGTANGTSFRIPDEGIEAAGKNGDMFVKISVTA